MKFNGPDFRCEDKVSIWVSQTPYALIPDSYFEEDFRCKGGAPVNEWAGNYGFGFYDGERLATNGVMEGSVSLQHCAGECSFSSSFVEELLAQARTQQLEQITWLILLYDFAYDPQQTGVTEDAYTRFVGVFDYNDEADGLY
ncbi:immunity 22 family protein [Marinobacterium arenosum]|uniref:immunity 22 family protein n=1 Tax=Marinobacterium arenosum TaxID=2862496 RepID=UPI001C94F5F4|nr:immunity 22 family protein [Marinobacterium arenosum]MBY4676645.1 immunity 22 family protein [Marinobacterium arenosum]